MQTCFSLIIFPRAILFLNTGFKKEYHDHDIMLYMNKQQGSSHFCVLYPHWQSANPEFLQ